MHSTSPTPPDVPTPPGRHVRGRGKAVRDDARMLLLDKVAIVTGAGSGIGRASAQRFAAEGAAVLAADIRLGKASETVELIEGEGGRAVACQVDVANNDDVARMVATA